MLFAFNATGAPSRGLHSTVGRMLSLIGNTAGLEFRIVSQQLTSLKVSPLDRMTAEREFFRHWCEQRRCAEDNQLRLWSKAR